MYTALLMLVTLTTCIALIMLVFVAQAIGTTLNRTKAPYVPIPKKALEQLPQLLALNNKSIVYDLGCGDGRVLITLAKQYTTTKFIGIEYSWFPYILATCNVWKSKAHNVRIIRKNFFKHPLTDATHVITYLFPKVMDALLPKLNQELSPGTILVSFDFTFTNKQPTQSIPTQSPRLGKTIYMYRF